MSARSSVYLGVWLGLLHAGCSLVLDPEEKQCSKDDPCVSPYVCGKAGFCERQTGCTLDSDCLSGGVCREGVCEKDTCETTKDCGDGKLCDTTTLNCVAAEEATCKRSADCVGYEDAACNRPLGHCSQIECTSKGQCDTSPTVSCEEGICEDPQWGCLGDPDLRIDDMSSAGSLEFKVIYIFPATGELETGVRDLAVRVCPSFDPNCTRPVTEDWTYESNLLTIGGLENGKSYTIRLQAKHPSNDLELLETEYQMYRTVVGKTVDPRPIVMFEAAFRAQTAMVAGVTADPDLGVVLAYTLDCRGLEVAGVSIIVDRLTVGCGGDPMCATLPFYFTTANLPDPGSTQTSLAGRLGIANMMTDVPNLLTLTRTADNKKITSFVVMPRKNVITYTFFYPQNFGTSQ